MILIVTTACLLFLGPSTIAHQVGEVLEGVHIDNGTFFVHEKNIVSILSKVDATTDVGVISIGGEFRKGKSFILNFFLQYLEWKQKHPDEPSSRVIPEDELDEVIEAESHPWLKNVDRNFGFQFKSGTIRDTTGINLWSEPFVIKSKKSGKNTAVLLMDSQGLYDEETSDNDNVRLFTMVSMLSSTLMLNTPNGNINFNQMTDLKYFMKYASSSINIDDKLKLFQTLTFLVRDYDLGNGTFGWDAGNLLLNPFMHPNESQPEELKKMSSKLMKAFDQINAFALPFPGNGVTRKEFDGSLQDIDYEFLEHLQRFVIDTVDNLEARKPMLDTLRASTFLNHITTIAKNYNSNLPPDKMIELQEREIINRVRSHITSLIDDHDNELRDFIDRQCTSTYTKMTINQIKDLVLKEHVRIKQQITNKQSSNTSLNLNLGVDDKKKGVTGHEMLQSKLSQRYVDHESTFVRPALNKRLNGLKERSKVIGDYNCCPLMDTHDSTNALFAGAYEGPFKRINRFFGLIHLMGAPINSRQVLLRPDSKWEDAYEYGGQYHKAISFANSSWISNTFQCSYGWWTRPSYDAMPDSTAQRFFPSVSGKYLARIYDDGWFLKGYCAGTLNNQEGSNIQKCMINLDPECDFWCKRGSGSEVFYINCAASVKNHYKASLRDVSYDNDKKVERLDRIVVASKTVTNYNAELKKRLGFSESVTNSYTMFIGSGSIAKSSTYLDFVLPTDSDIKLLPEALRSRPIVDSLFKYSSANKNVTKDIRINQDVEIGKWTKSATVNLVVDRVKTSLPFRMTFRILDNGMNRVIDGVAALRKIGFYDIEKVSCVRDENLITYEGTLYSVENQNARIEVLKH